MSDKPTKVEFSVFTYVWIGAILGALLGASFTLMRIADALEKIAQH